MPTDLFFYRHNISSLTIYLNALVKSVIIRSVLDLKFFHDSNRYRKYSYIIDSIFENGSRLWINEAHNLLFQDMIKNSRNITSNQDLRLALTLLVDSGLLLSLEESGHRSQ